MAVLKHFSIKNSPLATLKYIVGETKEHKAAIVTGLKCSEDPESAYMEMAMCYEHFAGEKFHRVGNPTGKEHLKMHHYVISFKGGRLLRRKLIELQNSGQKRFLEIIIRY